MPLGKAYTLGRAAYSSGSLTVTATVTQKHHPQDGKGFEFLVFEECTVKTDAKSSALKGNGAWPVARTQTMAEDPSAEIGGVPAEERLRFIDFIGADGGAASTSMTLTITAQLPGYDADIVKLEGWKWENCAEFTFNREGSTETATGPFDSATINGIDPIDQRFA